MIPPKVTIVVTAYEPESKRYLDLCVRSIENLSYPFFETIIVGRPDYQPQYIKAKTVTPPLEKFYPPVGLNYGIAHMSPDSEYLFLINDDVILTKHSLMNMVNILAINPSIGILMPIGNDVQGKFHAAVGIPPGPYEYDQLAPQANHLINMNSIYPQSLFFYDELCLYAMLIKRSVNNEVGGFNEKLRFNDDIDYSRRVRLKGYLNAITTNAIVYHFGGVSTKGKLSEQERKESLDIFNKEWPA